MIGRARWPPVAAVAGNGGSRWRRDEARSTLDDQLSTMLEQYEDMLSLYPHTGVNLARKHMGWYTKGLPRSAELRNRVNQQDDPKVVVEMLGAFYALRCREQRPEKAGGKPHSLCVLCNCRARRPRGRACRRIAVE